MVNIEATTPESRILKNIFDAVEALDIDSTAQFYSNDFKLHFIPKSNERPDLTKDEYIQTMKGMLTAATNTEGTIHDLVETPGKIAFHATWKGTSRDGATVSYDVFRILTFVEEEGELKIIEAKDFIDPIERSKLESLVAKSQALKV